MNIFMRFPEGRVKAVTLSYDDGVFQDIRLMEILDRYGIKCTFNVNSATFGNTDAQGSGRLSVKQAKELYTNSGHEVAVHTATHPFLETLPITAVLNEVLEDRTTLEKMFGTIVRGMAYPYGTYSDSVVEALKMCGIAFSRTTKSTENFTVPTDWLRLPATCHHNHPKLLSLCDDFLTRTSSKPMLFYLWGHSYEFDNNNNWNVIEEFCEKMGGKDDLWYATNIEIYDYVTAYNNLIYSVDARRIYNPNVIPVWLAYGDWKHGTTVKIEPGQTIVL